MLRSDLANQFDALMSIALPVDPIETTNPSLNFYAPGARDLLPLAVAQKRWVEGSIESTFQGWGYHQIITSTLEPLETLMAGGAIDRETVIQIPDPERGLLGLRPELTASIARAAVTRMSDIYPQRLYYKTNIFRRAAIGHYGRQQEFYQAGVELLGAAGSLADVEILLLAIDCLDKLGVPDYQIVLGEATLTRALLAEFPVEYQQQIRHCLAHLDRVTLSQLPLAPRDRELALAAIDLRGNPQAVLGRLAQLQLSPESKAIIANLQGTIELLAASRKAELPIVLDLSSIETFDYYTGIVFKAVAIAGDLTHVVAQGGRYDRLLALYHPQRQDCPGIGFSLNIEDLQQVLQSHPAMPRQTAQPDYLVAPIDASAGAAAFAYARQLRQQPDTIVEIYLEPVASITALQSIARDRQIASVALVDASGKALEN
jgi:ATP phosphoribosyltransferase regulatory subunit